MKKRLKSLLALLLVLQMFLPTTMLASAAAEAESKDSTYTQDLDGDLTGEDVVINPVEFGADPSGKEDSAIAIWDAFVAAQKATENGAASVTVSFPKGEYHVYKDYAQQREYHTSNTNSTDHPIKPIGILIENQKNFTMEGNGSLFMIHGNMMALAVVKSENVLLHDFSWDFAVPTVSEMTVVGMGSDGSAYTDFYIPECFPYEISGTTLVWHSEKSPYTGQYYWTETGIHNAYSVVAYQPEEDMSRAYFTNQGPFQNATRIEQLENNTIRIYYSSRPSMQKEGMIFELCSSAHRETAGAFFWESTNVEANTINVHFMHGFGWLTQMCTNVAYRNCNFVPREGTGKHTVSFADGLHASGAAGDYIVENCNFANTHDDPINLHGTFTRVEQRIDDNTLKLKYIHNQQGGFPQFHEGDKVVFYTRDLLTSTDNETEYTVSEVVSNPGEQGNDLKTMIVKFAETLPSNLSEQISGQPRFVCENITYAPKVTIRGNTFKNVTTRGILCTTRNPVVIEDNTFLNMSMATIYLSNDSDEWYESGPIRDMTIRNNEFYIKSIGRTSWEYAPAIYIHPVTKGGGLPDPNQAIHKNIAIEGNTFHMDLDCVVKAESVENLTIKDNTVLRYNPDVELAISAETQTLQPGASLALETEASANSNSGTAGQGNTANNNYDNLYEFTKCKNVVIEGNTYDDGLKTYAVLRDAADSESEIHISDDAAVVTRTRNNPPSDVLHVQYATSDASIATVDENGVVTAVKTGAVDVFAYYEWNGSVLYSDPVRITVEGSEVPGSAKVTIAGEDNLYFDSLNATHQFSATVEGTETAPVWTVNSLLTGGATEIASIDATGLLTAKAPGVAVVKVSVGAASDTRTVIVSPVHQDGLRPGFSIAREDKESYSLESDKLTMVMRDTDLYTKTNTAQVFLYEVPAGVNKADLWTAVHVDNLPVKKANSWDTASFLLYKDDDNYITIGKKNHYNGFAAVNETAAVATEIGESGTANNSVSSADLAFHKSGNTVKMYYKVSGGQWTEWAGSSASSFSDAAIGDSYKIGFAVWGGIGAGTKVDFSNFRVADGSAITAAADLDSLESISMMGYENEPPVISDLAFEKEAYTAGETVQATYSYSDPENYAEKGTLYKWALEDAAGVTTVEVTQSSSYIPTEAGTLTCTVYPTDAYSAIGNAVSKTVTVNKASQSDLSLSAVTVNGTLVEGFDPAKGDYEVKLPAGVSSAKLGYVSKSAGEGGIEVLVNDEAQPGMPNSGSLVVPADSTVTLRRDAEHTYIVKVTAAADSAVSIDTVSVPEIGFEETSPVPASNYAVVDADKKQVTLQITAATHGGELSITRDESRTPVETTDEGDGTYAADITLLPGINSYYIQVTADDGIIQERRMVHITRKAGTDASLSGLTVNGEALPGFDPDETDYQYILPNENETAITVDAAVADAEATCSITVNGVRTEGASVSTDALKVGLNTIVIAVKADDGMTTRYYTLTAMAPNDTNAKLLKLEVSGAALSTPFSPETFTYGLDFKSDKLTVSASAQEPDAMVVISSNGTLRTGTGSAVFTDAAVYEGANEITVTVISPDRSATEVYRLNSDAEPTRYLSDLTYEAGSTVGYGSIQLDKSSDGKPLTLMGEDSQPVTYERGLGTHANSTIIYDIAGAGYTRFMAHVGVDQEVNSSNYPNLVFEVTVDGTSLFKSNTLYANTPSETIDVAIPEDAQEIRLSVTQAQNGNWNAHADWADAKFMIPLEGHPGTDRTALNETMMEAAQLDGTQFTQASWKAVQDALAAASALAETATQDEIDGAAAALRKAIDDLDKPVPGTHQVIATYSGNAALLSVDGEAEEILSAAGVYAAKAGTGTELTFHFAPALEGRSFTSAMLGDQKIDFSADGCSYTFPVGNEDATLKFAFTVSNKTVLKSMIEKAEALQGGDEYTAAVPSVQKAFDKALQAAQTVDEKEDATQEEIDAAWKALLDAIHHLSFAEGDPTKLNDLLEIVGDLAEEDFTTASWANLQNAVELAKDVLSGDELLQAELDKAYDTLDKAIKDLEYRADRSQLDMLITQANVIKDALNEYLETGKQGFLDALAIAEALDAEAGQSAVDKAASDLNKAILNLRKIPNKDALKAMIEKAELIDTSKYTASSVSAFKASLKLANTIMNGNVYDQEEVDSAANGLARNMNGLVENTGRKPSSSGKSSAVHDNTYGAGGTALVSAAQGVSGASYVISDTTVNFTLKRGAAYCFKMTMVNGNMTPNFTVGNGNILKTQFVTKIGNDSYYRVYAIGTAGQSTGVYTQTANAQPQKHCTITVG